MTRDMSLVLSATAVALWLCGLGLVLLANRRPGVPAAQAGGELRPETPAVVNLLVHDMVPAGDLAEATVLDLIARGFLKGGRGAVHIGSQLPSGLTEHEQQVYDSVNTTFQPRKVYPSALREAREAGLSRRRFDPRTLGWLAGSAVVVAVVVAGSIRWASGNNAAFLAGFGVLVALFGLIAAGQRAQLTAKGVEAAQHWLGVRAFLLGQPDLPGRFAAYGVALGLGRDVSLALGLDTGRDVAWSQQGGRWRRVRVDYPAGWDRYGRSPGDVLRQAGLRVGAGAALLLATGRIPLGEIADKVALVLGGYLVLRGIYLAVRAALDLVIVKEIGGLVLAVDKWRSGTNLHVWNTPNVRYLVVDSGHTDRVTAWALPFEAPQPKPGESVRAKVRPWSRRIVDIGLSVSDDEPRPRSRGAHAGA